MKDFQTQINDLAQKHDNDNSALSIRAQRVAKRVIKELTKRAKFGISDPGYIMRLCICPTLENAYLTYLEYQIPQGVNFYIARLPPTIYRPEIVQIRYKVGQFDNKVSNCHIRVGRMEFEGKL